MPNWGAEIPVTIVDRKPDFVGDDDVCSVYSTGSWWGLSKKNKSRYWTWDPGITAIKLLADHPYYTEDKPMIISEAAAKEALRRFGRSYDNISVDRVVRGKMDIGAHELAKAIQRLWDLCPSERPVDNRVIAMRHAWLATICPAPDYEKAVVKGAHDCIVINALAAFDAKLAELEGGK